MISKAFLTALATDAPVLFTYIGWATEYRGTEPVIGGHAYLKRHPRDNAEARAFVKDEDGFFLCGIGRGQVPVPVHIVFIAVDSTTQTKKLAGVYAAASVEMDREWARANASCSSRKQGMRRWARGHKKSYSSLLRVFESLKSDLPEVIEKDLPRHTTLDQTYSGIEAREGEQYERLVIHRRREGKLRKAKIEEALSSNGGSLICEVPRCGFDFHARYGDLGYVYAHVHHRNPLSDSKRRKKTTLAELAIVCANCHAMIHRNGECRDLKHLIPPKRKSR